MLYYCCSMFSWTWTHCLIIQLLSINMSTTWVVCFLKSLLLPHLATKAVSLSICMNMTYNNTAKIQRQGTSCTQSFLCFIYCQVGNTQQKGHTSSIELKNSFLTFRSPQTSIELFIAEKKRNHRQPFLMCTGSKENRTVFYSYTG